MTAVQMSRSEIRTWLMVRGTEQQELFARARAVREENFGRTSVVRGVIEATSACVKSCEYCPMRVEGRIQRYFLKSNRLLEIVAHIHDFRIPVVFFQAGEVPRTTREVGEIIPQVKAMYGGNVEVLLNLGDKRHDEYAYLRQQGADSYIIKHETADPDLHFKIRKTSLAARLEHVSDLVTLGYRVGVGTIVGLPGQTLESLIDDILLPAQYGAGMTSAAPFIPAPETPLADAPDGDVELALNVIALMRINNPTCLVPSVSALEKLQPGGQRRGFEAGANVITINFTPPTEKVRYPIYGKERYVVTLDHAMRTLESVGLEPKLLGSLASAA
jgi:biotin synthase